MASKLENKFFNMWKRNYPELLLKKEQILIPNRKFRFDFTHIPSKTVIEINGGIWIQGRHARASGLIKEYEKLNLAQIHGYTVFILSGNMITKSWLNSIANTIKKS